MSKTERMRSLLRSLTQQPWISQDLKGKDRIYSRGIRTRARLKMYDLKLCWIFTLNTVVFVYRVRSDRSEYCSKQAVFLNA